MIRTQPTGTRTPVKEEQTIPAPSQSTQPGDENQAGLKPVQWRAVESLAVGGRIVDAARLAGVHRNTVSRWLDDPLFVEQLNLADRRLHEAARSRVFAMTEMAATSVEHALARGDGRLGLQVLKAHGLFQHSAPPLRQGEESGREASSPPDEPQEQEQNDATLATDGLPGNGLPSTDDLPDKISPPDHRPPTKPSPSSGDETADESKRYVSPLLGDFSPDVQPAASEPWDLRDLNGADLNGADLDGPQPASDNAPLRYQRQGRWIENPSFAEVLWCLAAWFATHHYAPFCTMIVGLRRFCCGFVIRGLACAYFSQFRLGRPILSATPNASCSPRQPSRSPRSEQDRVCKGYFHKIVRFLSQGVKWPRILCRTGVGSVALGRII